MLWSGIWRCIELSTCRTGASGSRGRPRCIERLGRDLGEREVLLELAEEGVGEDDHRVPILEREREAERGEAGHLGYRARGEDDVAVPAVPTSPGRLEVVRLLRSEASEARPASVHVDDEHRELRGRGVGDGLLLEAEARAGGGGHRLRARRGRAQDHVHGLDLARRLEEDLELGVLRVTELVGEGLRDLARGRDRVAKEGVEARLEGPVGQRLVSLEEVSPGRHGLHLATSAIAKSGQTQ